jgi:hypothetical protein
MTSPKKAALLVLLASLTVSSVGPIQAQQRKTTTTNVPRYTPPPAPRPAPRPEPEPQNRPEYRSYNAPPENRSYNNNNSVQPESRPGLGANHPNATAFRPTVITPALTRAMTYNSRPGGIRINPSYFATHYGRAYGFHFNDPANCCVLRGSEW